MITNQLIEGLAVVGVSLLILGIFVGTQKEKSTSDMSVRDLMKDLGYRSFDSSSSVRSVRSGPYPDSEDTHTFGGKRKKKTRKNNN
jgi:hypothetical protein